MRWFGVAAAIAVAACGRNNGEPPPATTQVPAEVLSRTTDAAPPPPPSGERAAYTRSVHAMGTRLSVSIWTADEVTAARATRAVFDEFERVNKVMSSWLPDSDVARINAAAGADPVVVADEVLSVIERARGIADETGGAFDITVGGFRGLWKFDEDLDGSIPTETEVKARLPLIGYRKIHIDRAAKTVKLAKPGMRITLGGIAKGYAVDRAVAILRGHGISDFIVQAGGDLYVSGRRGDRAWRVGIRDPRGLREESFAVLELENGTFSTSGDYERSLVKDGRRYHHLIDPATGYPATRSRSVTVLAKDAITADVWSTSLFIMGHERGMPLVEKMPDVEAVFVDADNKVHISSGLESRLKILHPPTDGV